MANGGRIRGAPSDIGDSGRQAVLQWFAQAGPEPVPFIHEPVAGDGANREFAFVEPAAFCIMGA